VTITLQQHEQAHKPT